MTPPARRGPRRALLALGGLLLLAALIRASQATFGALPATQAIGELGAVGSLVIVLGAVVPLARRARGLGWALIALTLTAWGGAIVAPLWRMAYPPRPLYRGELGGTVREAQLPATPRAGRYELTLGRAGGGDGRRPGAYLLHVMAGTYSRSFSGAVGDAPERLELSLPAHQPVRLVLQHSDTTLRVGLHAPPIPWRWVRLACLLAAVLATLADMVAAEPRRRGFLTTAVAISAVFVAQLDPETAPGGMTALAALFVAAITGTIFAVAMTLGLGRIWPGRA